MNKAPTIKGSAQARLLLYQLLSRKLVDTEESLLTAEPASWEQILSMLERAIESDAQGKSDHTVLTQTFTHIDRTTREGLERQIERLTGKSLWLGVHATGLLESFVDEHTRLIKSVQREHLEKINLSIKRGIREGRLPKDIAKDIRQMTGMGKRRARLIARNAPLQYSGALTKHHQTSAGIKKYRWQTSQDERVRDTHASRNGKVYSWVGPGPHPRSEVNCRCDAVPVIAL
jgi:SPP1 gp7 family putative phage head morphogenesis protein